MVEIVIPTFKNNLSPFPFTFQLHWRCYLTPGINIFEGQGTPTLFVFPRVCPLPPQKTSLDGKQKPAVPAGDKESSRIIHTCTH